jgi:hypothetical protein
MSVSATYTITPIDYRTNAVKRSLVDEILGGTLLSKRDIACVEYRDGEWWALAFDCATGEHSWVRT